MKKIIINLLVFLMLISLCGCSNSSNPNEDSKTVYTEEEGNLLITYIYDYDDIISKNVYDKNTGITTDYTYFYHNNGWGKNLVGINIVAITKDGIIIDKFESD